MKTILSAVLGLSLLMLSCRKDIGILETIAPIPNYTPLTVGSYWVYDWYVVDSMGNATITSPTDSVYIVGDTIIGSDTFAIQVGTWFGQFPIRKYLRDSSGYLINPGGAKLFSAINYIDTLYTWYPINGQSMGYCKMTDIGEMVTVPVGTFRTLNAAYTVVNLVGSWPCIGIYDIHDNQYAENVGLVRTSFQWTPDYQCRVYEGRLRNYLIN